jgi:mono/diheme cytochrome c family protein
MPKRHRFTRSQILAAAALLALGGLLALSRHHSNWNAPDDVKRMRNPVPADPAGIAAGKAVYGHKCANCHGVTGDGKGGDAYMYSVQPAPFNNPATLAGKTDGELFWKISEGRRPMPGFRKRLTETERWQVIRYIRTFAPAAQTGGKIQPRSGNPSAESSREPSGKKTGVK